jgi:rubredoxin
MVNFTCNICGTEYNNINGETDEKMCNNCFEYDDILDDENEKEIK